MTQPRPRRYQHDNNRSATGRNRPIARRGVAAPRIVHGFVCSSPSVTAVLIAAEKPVGLRLPRRTVNEATATRPNVGVMQVRSNSR